MTGLEPMNSDPGQAPPLERAASSLRQSAEARKCWPCGCLHHALEEIRDAYGNALPDLLQAPVGEAEARRSEQRYECLGCPVCYPAEALGALAEAEPERTLAPHACPTEAPAVRAGWPPLAGDYQVVRYRGPVAVCTLNSEALATRIAEAAPVGLAIAGTLHTENLGIERLVQNVLANPHIRFLVLCGPDTQQAIGHLPGQSLLALHANGIDARGRIVGAKGRRPVLRNLIPEAVARFREVVSVVDLIGSEDPGAIASAVARCAAADPGPAEPWAGQPAALAVPGALPERMEPDPEGYFVIHPERNNGRIALEHYRNEGVLDVVVEGDTAESVYTVAIERGLLSRLDHAAYLGRELARAEAALRRDEPYIQDGVTERSTVLSDNRAPPTEAHAASHCDGEACGPS